MPAQHHVGELLQTDEIHDIRDVSVEIHLPRPEMRTFPNTRESRREHIMSAGLKSFADTLPHPASTPPPVHQAIYRHLSSSRDCRVIADPSLPVVRCF